MVFGKDRSSEVNERHKKRQYVFFLLVSILFMISLGGDIYRSWSRAEFNCYDDGLSQAVEQLTNATNTTAKWLAGQLQFPQTYQDIIENSKGFTYFWDVSIRGGVSTSLTALIENREFTIRVRSWKSLEKVRDYEDCMFKHRKLHMDISTWMMLIALLGLLLIMIVSIVVLIGVGFYKCGRTICNCCKTRVRHYRSVEDGSSEPSGPIIQTISGRNVDDEIGPGDVTTNGGEGGGGGGQTRTICSWNFLRTVLPCMHNCQENSESEVGRDGRQSLFKKEIDGTHTQEEVEQVLMAMKSVGVLFIGRQGRGTGVRVGSRYVMTAWHVVKDIVCPPTVQFRGRGMDSTLLAEQSISVKFNESEFRFLPELVFYDPNLDAAVLELDVNDGNRASLPAPIRNFADVFSINSRKTDIPFVNVIGQHPQRDVTVVDFQCKHLSRYDEKVVKVKRWIKKHMATLKRKAISFGDNPNLIETGIHDVYDTQKYLIFDTYLERGGSGGAVIAHLPAKGVALVAILSHGLPNFNPHKENKYNLPDECMMEVGCTLKAIHDSPKWKGLETIRDDIFSPQSIPPIPMETDS